MSNKNQSVVFTSTTDAAGNFVDTSQFQCDGIIDRVAVRSDTWTNGSIVLFTRGESFVPENILQASAISGGKVFYPRAMQVNVSGTQLAAGDLGGGTKVAVQDYLQVSGIGLGNTTTGKIEVYYR